MTTIDSANRWYRRGTRLAAVVAGCIWIGLAGAYAVGPWPFDPYGVLVAADHLAFYTPARFVLEGRDGDFYRYEIVQQVQAERFPGQWDGLEAFRNPPFYALLYVPTAGFPYPASALIWTGVSLGCLVLGVRWLGAVDPWRTAFWAATFYPVYCVISYGQNSLLSFAILAATYRLLLSERRFAAGCVAGLLWFKPPLLLGLFVWWALDIRQFWRCWLGVVFTGTVLVCGSYPIIPAAWAGFIDSLTHNATFAEFDQWKMHNPRAFWRLLLPGESLGSVRTLLTLALSAMGLVAFLRLRNRRRNEIGILFGATVALTLWISPHALIYEWAIAVIPAILWWNHAPEHRPRWRCLFAVLWVTFLVATDFDSVVWWVEREWLGMARPWMIQFSIPVAGWVGWQAVRTLISEPQPVGSHGSEMSVNSVPVTSIP